MPKTNRKAYVGAKLVVASPMTAGEFAQKHDRGLPASKEEPGYEVIYEDQYYSWSPKDVFDKAYHEVNIDMAKFLIDSGRKTE